MLGDLCGPIDVKVPSKDRKLVQWKVWRRQWCVVRRSADNSLQLVLSNSLTSDVSCIDIPHNAVLCRSQSRTRTFAFGIFCPSSVGRLGQAAIFLACHSETESQKWILEIRKLISAPNFPVEHEEFIVSLIDNAHSRSAGLTGLYGTLRTNLSGVSISDFHTGQVKVQWQWSQLDTASICSPIVPEDHNHLLKIRTLRANFSEFSCGEGELLLFCLEAVTLESVLNKYLARPQYRHTSSPLPPVPLLSSRRLSQSEGDLRCWSAQSNLALIRLRTQSVSRNTNNDKVASSLLSAGLGLMIATPGCSEPDSLHDYQCLNAPLPELPRQRNYMFSSVRRESGVSVASGIYEEITESPGVESSTSMSMHTPPPPLPPRKQDPRGSAESQAESEEPLIYSVVEEEEPMYMPMSPVSQEEQTYVVMANLVNKHHFTEPVI